MDSSSPAWFSWPLATISIGPSQSTRNHLQTNVADGRACDPTHCPGHHAFFLMAALHRFVYSLQPLVSGSLQSNGHSQHKYIGAEQMRVYGYACQRRGCVSNRCCSAARLLNVARTPWRGIARRCLCVWVRANGGCACVRRCDHRIRIVFYCVAGIVMCLIAEPAFLVENKCEWMFAVFFFSPCFLLIVSCVSMHLAWASEHASMGRTNCWRWASCWRWDAMGSTK